MSKVLYIKSNPKSDEDSKTYRIANAFIEEYKSIHPEDEIITLDLYDENIGFLSLENIASAFGPKDESSRNHPTLKYAYQFAEADKYIVAAPMWNLGAPAILKAYIDYISVKEITFKYTAEGLVGLCGGKSALFVAARGGDYSSPIGAEMEMGERYIKSIFNMYGIKDFHSVSANMVDVQGMDVDKIINDAISKAKSIAKDF